MSFRGTALASLALAGLVPPSPRHLATTRYRLDTESLTVVDLSGFGQPNQEVRITIAAWIAVTLSDTIGGRIAHIVVDSVRYQGTAPTLSQEGADSAKGGTLHGSVTGDGRIKEITFRPAENLFLVALRELAQGLFPRLKAEARPGERWSDTVETATNVAGANTLSRAMVDYVVVAPEAGTGIPGLQLESQSALALTGTVDSPPMGILELSGTGQGAGTHWIGTDGVYSGGRSTVKLNQLLKSATAPLPIPLVTTTTSQVTRLP